MGLMTKKKKRNKRRKKSGEQTKARRAEQAAQAEEVKAEEAEEAKAAEESAEEDASSEEAEAEATEAKAETKAEPKKDKKKDKKKAKKKAEVSAATVMLQQAQADFEAGRYRAARAQIVEMLDKHSPSPEEREQANELFGNMEMDVRTLMVGAVAMVTLLLIPTLGYTNFANALWTIPVLFLLLIVDPRLFRSPDDTASDEN